MSTATTPIPEPKPVRISERTWALAFTKLATAFPSSFSDEPTRLSKKGLWTEMIDTRDWLIEPVFVQGLYQMVWHHEGNFIPEPATALKYFEAARVEVERETAKAQAAALPPPKPQHVEIHSVGQLIAEAARRHPELIQQAAERQRRARLEALAERGEHDTRSRVVRVEWTKDGRPDGVSEVELPAKPFVLDTEARRQERAKALKDAQAPDWYECLCGTSVLRYPDGRVLEAADQAPHYCLAAKRGR